MSPRQSSQPFLAVVYFFPFYFFLRMVISIRDFHNYTINQPLSQQQPTGMLWHDSLVLSYYLPHALYQRLLIRFKSFLSSAFSSLSFSLFNSPTCRSSSFTLLLSAMSPIYHFGSTIRPVAASPDSYKRTLWTPGLCHQLWDHRFLPFLQHFPDCFFRLIHLSLAGLSSYRICSYSSPHPSKFASISSDSLFAGFIRNQLVTHLPVIFYIFYTAVPQQLCNRPVIQMHLRQLHTIINFLLHPGYLLYG